ncbi:nitrite extrusion protein (nitrite facilitator) [Rubidibacter lacunae KORDI 51-2]|uniref:Nitrate/nitrite transporter n=1 Tax=Rubidibacter lacunae KORDI 51-2 TaxID=582515 RepID=U5DKB0_9CHRO|nr:MFS transporter [Rubidibacter lacunae]ERN40125.1 nitrite extrusion protein (nitrite facilitator) [Rubidibacter lacunae KORDI 51-2]
MLGNLVSFSGRYRILHLTWFAFFLTFVVWFNLPPLATTVKEAFGLEVGQLRTLAMCNVALTVPARIIIGMLLDRFGPRITYSTLLVYAAFPCLIFATAQDFNMLVIGRLLLGIVGAGFVIGIRMVAEWFPPKEIGTAEGIYGGWGNFGSAASSFALPVIAGWLAFGAPGSPLNWRLAIAMTGIIAAIYGVIYFYSAEDTPAGKVYQRPKRHGSMEVTTKRDFWFLLVMNVPLIGVLGLLAWRLRDVGFLNNSQMYLVWAGLAALFLFQSYKAFDVNKDLMTGKKRYEPSDRYEFSQVAILDLTYIVNFGSELAVVSMLPAFFELTFSLSKELAGMIAASYAFMNLMSRPGGGWISDRMGSRKWTMAILLFGMGIGYMLMGTVTGGWWLPAAVLLTMGCSFFVQASEGSTFAIVPLIKRRVTGQIAGNVGAYGTVGAVLYTTLYSLVSDNPAGDRIFFYVLGTAGLIVGFLCVFVLKEPKGSFSEFHEGEDAAIEATAPAFDAHQA